jgi:hypothetical protein
MAYPEKRKKEIIVYCWSNLANINCSWWFIQWCSSWSRWSSSWGYHRRDSTDPGNHRWPLNLQNTRRRHRTWRKAWPNHRIWCRITRHSCSNRQQKHLRYYISNYSCVEHSAQKNVSNHYGTRRLKPRGRLQQVTANSVDKQNIFPIIITKGRPSIKLTFAPTEKG